MAYTDLMKDISLAKFDLIGISNTSNYAVISKNLLLQAGFQESQQLAIKWISRVEQLGTEIEDFSLRPLLLFTQRLVQIVNKNLSVGQTISDALKQARADFEASLPILMFGYLEANGIAQLSEQDFIAKRDMALKTISEAADSSVEKVVAKAKEAVDATEAAKNRASKISVDSATQQFEAATSRLRMRAFGWAISSGASLTALVWFALYMYRHPPALIQKIVEGMSSGPHAFALAIPTPLLLLAVSYFTGLRLALIGSLGVCLAFSLKMMRAYLHMAEHNQHKLHVTRSIEAFVAAVRTDEHRDLVLGKLVESVTEFGDSGLLGKQGETSNLPSVVLESVTKNIGKAD
jgi:hypothetical protein